MELDLLCKPYSYKDFIFFDFSDRDYRAINRALAEGKHGPFFLWLTQHEITCSDDEHQMVEILTRMLEYGEPKNDAGMESLLQHTVRYVENTALRWWEEYAQSLDVVAWRKKCAGRSLSPKRRTAILKRDGYRCRSCGTTAAEGGKLEVDHRSAHAKGGCDEDRNLWTLCFPCNRGKSDNPY